jgi:hypothetical protein
LAISFPLAVVACGAFWIGIRYPTANFWHNQGFGPNWECQNLGRSGAEACAPDLPDRLQKSGPP